MSVQINFHCTGDKGIYGVGGRSYPSEGDGDKAFVTLKVTNGDWESVTLFFDTPGQLRAFGQSISDLAVRLAAGDGSGWVVQEVGEDPMVGVSKVGALLPMTEEFAVAEGFMQEVPPVAPGTFGVCNAFSEGGFLCTESVGHDGDHVALAMVEDDVDEEVDRWPQAVAPDPALFEDHGCCARSIEDYWCTRPEGHRGDHEARAVSGAIYASWQSCEPLSPVRQAVVEAVSS